MTKTGPDFFDQAAADKYDQQWSRLAPFRDALHLLTKCILAGLPNDARILCVGAGTGAEMLYLASQFPEWRFTAVEPSAPMLAVCRRRVAEQGLSERCVLHEGYLDSLPPSAPFDAATSILVSQFVTEPSARTGFFREIADRLRRGGRLITADLAADTATSAYESLLEMWLRVLQTADLTPEKLQQLRAAYGRDVAVWPPERISKMLQEASFVSPTLFLQTALIHAWQGVKG